jgi:tape measure domain-containing protein
MADDIDNKIVSMKFDNVAFERNLGETIRSLEKLRQSLNFADSTRGMGELKAASNSFNMNSMSNAVEGISGKFLALTTIALTSLATITTRAIDAGARIVKGFSIAPVMDGFREYETNINSIQTILANTDSKGTKLEDVNKALDELNKYADQTIYNFSEMTRNIGTFTAAGVDLDKSVLSIKGIANIAAISGSNSEQASTAMYQLSQAMASGTVKLMDWNSVVNAGMGGEVFQKALFEAGKAAKTLTNVPVGQTFEEWKKAGNTFRGSLETGWLTGEVLTKTLAGFTGDLTEAQIMAMGYTQAQAQEVMRLGKIGKAAATEVKTFTQLLGTVKEAVGSGWATSFRTIVGDFDEAKKLFTGLSNVIGGVVGRSADARNEMLKEWKELGGRAELLQGFENLFYSIGRILGPIGTAFRDIFPASTGKRLFELTQSFAKFTDSLRISSETANKIRHTFAGVFAVIEIGWNILKGVLGLIGQVVKSLAPAGSGLLSFTAGIGDTLVALNKALVEGGGIARFFERLAEVIKMPIVFIKELGATISAFFKGFSASEQMEQGLARVESRFDSLRNVSDRFSASWERLGNTFEGVRNVLSKVGDYIKNWFSSLGQKLAEAFQPGDFNAAVDILNVGLLGGIIVILRKFLSGDFLSNFGGGLFEKVTGALDQLTGTLKAMQAQVRAETLLKIAIAMGVLTASLVVLSMIDSVKLTSALVAMSIAFAQMVGVLTLLTKLTAGPASAAKIAFLSGALIALAGAMVILSLAIKVLSTLSWNEIAKGLVGVGVGLGLLIAAVYLLPPAPGLILTGIAMMGIASAMLILSLAVKSFADMSWSELAKGLIGIGVGLGVLTAAMSLMPIGPVLAAGAAMIPLAIGLTLLAGAVKAFSILSWGEMLKGLVGVAGALVIIAAAMHLMPLTLPLTAAGLILVGIALNVIALAVRSMGTIDFGSMAKGIGGLAVMLGILAAAMIVMTGTAAGAAAMLVASGALVVLAGVLKILGGMSIGEIVKGLAAMAGVFVVLGVAALLLGPVVPILYSLGAALTLLGAGFALFGIGAMLVAKAFETLARAGKAGLSVLIESIKLVIKAIPEFIGAFVQALVELASEIIAAIPLLVRLLTALLSQLLETVITLAPKIGQAIGAILSTGLKIIRELFPEALTTGFLLLMEFLRGVRDNIGEITTVAVDIMVNFVQGLISNMEKLVNAGIELLTAFLNSIANRIGEVVAAGANVLISLVVGIAENMFRIIDIVTSIVTNFITEIGNNASKFVTAGADALIDFVSGILKNLIKVSNAATDLVVEFISGIDDNALKIINAAADMVIDFLNGLATVIREKSGEFNAAGRNIVGAIIDGMMAGLKDTPVIGQAINMAKGIVGAVKGVFEIFSPSKVFRDIARNVVASMGTVFGTDKTAQNSAVIQAERIITAFQKTLEEIPDSISGMDNFNPVITPVLDLTKIQSDARNINKLMRLSTISPDISYAQASHISRTTGRSSIDDVEPMYTGPSEIKFEQNNYSPKALSTNDIYRSTKSQIALAKEELGIL